MAPDTTPTNTVADENVAFVKCRLEDLAHRGQQMRPTAVTAVLDTYRKREEKFHSFLQVSSGEGTHATAHTWR